MILTIPMEPMGKARPRLGGKRGSRNAFMPDSYRAWKSRFAFHAKRQWNAPMFKGLVHVTTEFVTLTGNCRSDGDNSHASCLDALEGIAYLNDRCVKSGAYSIRKGDEVCIRVTVEGLA